MINPNDDGSLDSRVGRLEQGQRLLLKLSKYHEANVRELLAITTRIELTQGDTNERFDTIERKLDQVLDLLKKL